MKRKTTQPPKIGLALSGDGPLGTIYEVGALCAMQKSLKRIDLTQLGHELGVSAGGFIAADLVGLQSSPSW